MFKKNNLLLTTLILPVLLASTHNAHALSTAQKRTILSTVSTIAGAVGAYNVYAIAKPHNPDLSGPICAFIGGALFLIGSMACAETVFPSTTPELITNATQLYEATHNKYGAFLSHPYRYNLDSLPQYVHRAQNGSYTCLSLCQALDTAKDYLCSMINNLAQRKKTLSTYDANYHEIHALIEKLNTLVEQIENLMLCIQSSSCYTQELAHERYVLEEQRLRDQKEWEGRHCHQQPTHSVTCNNYVHVQTTITPAASQEKPAKKTTENKTTQTESNKQVNTKNETTTKNNSQLVEHLVDNGDLFSAIN